MCMQAVSLGVKMYEKKKDSVMTSDLKFTQNSS